MLISYVAQISTSTAVIVSRCNFQIDEHTSKDFQTFIQSAQSSEQKKCPCTAAVYQWLLLDLYWVWLQSVSLYFVSNGDVQRKTMELV
jgi:hypothetical protein